MKILICGDRNWTDREKIAQQLRLIYILWGFEAASEFGIPEIIHGAARGADTIAGEEAAKLGFLVTAVPAEWQTYGRAAGPIRNQVMLEMKPDLVLAFHSNLEESRGTKDMVERARTASIPTEIITSCKPDSSRNLVNPSLASAWERGEVKGL